MAKSPSPVPTGYHSVTPYLRVKGAAAAIEFYKSAFGAKERYRLPMGDRIGHAEIDINGSTVMLSDEFPEVGAMGPATLKGTTVTLSLYVADARAFFAKAIAAGGKERRPLTDEFYGDRCGQIEDPFGHVWMISQRIEDVAPKEMQKRLDKMMAGGDPLATEKATTKSTEKSTEKVAAKPKARKARKG